VNKARELKVAISFVTPDSDDAVMELRRAAYTVTTAMNAATKSNPRIRAFYHTQESEVTLVKQINLEERMKSMSLMRSCAVLLIVVACIMATVGCVTSWEKNTFAALSVSKTAVDCAAAGYNHDDAAITKACQASPNTAGFDATAFYVPQTAEAKEYIEKARAAQTTIVEAFESYAVAKVGKDPTVSLSDKQALITNLLTQLPTILAAIHTLGGKSPTSGVYPPIDLHDTASTAKTVRTLLPLQNALSPPLEERESIAALIARR
jgi:hypothetical protein